MIILAAEKQTLIERVGMTETEQSNVATNITLLVVIALQVGLYFGAGCLYIAMGWTLLLERILQIAGIVTFAMIIFGFVSAVGRQENETHEETSGGDQDSNCRGETDATGDCKTI